MGTLALSVNLERLPGIFRQYQNVTLDGNVFCGRASAALSWIEETS
jgi:hypothetical protein